MRYGLARMPPSTPAEQRDAVAEREQADVQHDVLQPVEEEDHADQEQQVVVAGHHVLGAEVHQRTDGAALQPLQEDRVLAGHTVRTRGRPTSATSSSDAQAADACGGYWRWYLCMAVVARRVEVSPDVRMPVGALGLGGFQRHLARRRSSRASS